MKLIENPFLPNKKVSCVVAGNLNDSGRNYFSTYGINVIELPRIESVDERLNYHSDLFCLPTRNGLFLCNELKNFIFPDSISEIKKTFLNENLGKKYPFDVRLNGVFVGNNFICNLDTVADSVLQYIKFFDICNIIDVKQGYTKCSVCPVSENAFITDDESVYDRCKNDFDVLFIEKGIVKLNGFDYGFIGGATGKIDKDKLAFTGKIFDKKIENDVVLFCKKYSVECIWLSDENIYDIGSIIPITEVE